MKKGKKTRFWKRLSPDNVAQNLVPKGKKTKTEAMTRSVRPPSIYLRWNNLPKTENSLSIALQKHKWNMIFSQAKRPLFRVISQDRLNTTAFSRCGAFRRKHRFVRFSVSQIHWTKYNTIKPQLRCFEQSCSGLDITKHTEHAKKFFTISKRTPISPPASHI